MRPQRNDWNLTALSKRLWWWTRMPTTSWFVGLNLQHFPFISAPSPWHVPNLEKYWSRARCFLNSTNKSKRITIQRHSRNIQHGCFKAGPVARSNTKKTVCAYLILLSIYRPTYLSICLIYLIYLTYRIYRIYLIYLIYLIYRIYRIYLIDQIHQIHQIHLIYQIHQIHLIYLIYPIYRTYLTSLTSLASLISLISLSIYLFIYHLSIHLRSQGPLQISLSYPDPASYQPCTGFSLGGLIQKHQSPLPHLESGFG